jgi:hypothetical protein
MDLYLQRMNIKDTKVHRIARNAFTVLLAFLFCVSCNTVLDSTVHDSLQQSHIIPLCLPAVSVSLGRRSADPAYPLFLTAASGKDYANKGLEFEGD